MTHVEQLFGLIAVACAAVACNRMDPVTCAEQAMLDQATAAQGVGDWRTEADSIVATAPADSVLDFVVFVASGSRQDFTDWAGREGVTLTYEFHGFSAYSIRLEVGVLPSLKDAPGVTGVDWGVGLGWPAC